MGILVVQTYVVKPEKQEEYKAFLQRWLQFMKENPKEVEEIKSTKMFTQTIGGVFGGIVEMLEFNSLSDIDKYMQKAFKNKEHMKLDKEQELFTVPGTRSISIWSPLEL